MSSNIAIVEKKKPRSARLFVEQQKN